jgi:hypothetical protein
MRSHHRRPLFFSHHGFINEAFKQSIIKKYKTKKILTWSQYNKHAVSKNVLPEKKQSHEN